jgi:hypothetical protein
MSPVTIDDIRRKSLLLPYRNSAPVLFKETEVDARMTSDASTAAVVDSSNAKSDSIPGVLISV